MHRFNRSNYQVVIWPMHYNPLLDCFQQALTSECRTLRSVSVLNSPFLSDAAFKSLALCRRLHKIRIEGKDQARDTQSHLSAFL